MTSLIEQGEGYRGHLTFCARPGWSNSQTDVVIGQSRRLLRPITQLIGDDKKSILFKKTAKQTQSTSSIVAGLISISHGIIYDIINSQQLL